MSLTARERPAVHVSRGVCGMRCAHRNGGREHATTVSEAGARAHSMRRHNRPPPPPLVRMHGFEREGRACGSAGRWLWWAPWAWAVCCCSGRIILAPANRKRPPTASAPPCDWAVALTNGAWYQSPHRLPCGDGDVTPTTTTTTAAARRYVDFGTCHISDYYSARRAGIRRSCEANIRPPNPHETFFNLRRCSTALSHFSRSTVTDESKNARQTSRPITSFRFWSSPCKRRTNSREPFPTSGA